MIPPNLRNRLHYQHPHPRRSQSQTDSFNTVQGGSILRADYPSNGVNFARRSTVEDFGLADGQAHAEQVVRCRLPIALWRQIAEPVKAAFNERLKARNLKRGRWHASAATDVHRQFGKELCLLAWSLEACDAAAVQAGITSWLAMSPEGRWWLYAMCVSNGTGTADLIDTGWRKAIRVGMTESRATA
jgi:hypothetical protein